MAYWGSLGLGFDTCTFPSACITGCMAEEPEDDEDEGGPVTGPCFPTCDADTKSCVNDIIAQIGGDNMTPSELCADVKASGPSIADCFAAGECCGDMTATTALYESQLAFASCDSSPFPTECKQAANKVLLSVNLPIATKAEFTPAMRTQYRESVATAAGVLTHLVAITRVSEVDVRRRRLLAANLKVSILASI